MQSRTNIARLEYAGSCSPQSGTKTNYRNLRYRSRRSCLGFGNFVEADEEMTSRTDLKSHPFERWWMVRWKWSLTSSISFMFPIHATCQNFTPAIIQQPVALNIWQIGSLVSFWNLFTVVLICNWTLLSTQPLICLANPPHSFYPRACFQTSH